MEKIQEVSYSFFGPVTVSYLLACGFLLFSHKLFPSTWNVKQIETPKKPYVEAWIGILAIVVLLLVGNFLRLDQLLKTKLNEPWAGILWIITNFEIYGILFLVIWFRKQSIETLYLSQERVIYKVIIGLIIGVICISAFLLMRNEYSRILQIGLDAVKWKTLIHFPAVFLEGVAIAFLLVRLRWAFGTKISILIPSLLFAASHIPRSIENGSSVEEIICFLMLNTCVCAFVLFTTLRLKDVIALGMIHYLMDVCIKSFN